MDKVQDFYAFTPAQLLSLVPNFLWCNFFTFFSTVLHSAYNSACFEYSFELFQRNFLGVCVLFGNFETRKEGTKEEKDNNIEKTFDNIIENELKFKSL